MRYGGFAARHCVGTNGALEPAIEDADGELVPDRRGATFYVPPWVTLPAFLEPHLAARNARRSTTCPTRSSARCTSPTAAASTPASSARRGEQVVLKEARPHAGLATVDESDAVARLDRERDMLALLAGLGVPAVSDYFTVGEHHFLVMEFVEGEPLNHAPRRALPADLARRRPTRQRSPTYTDWALGILDAPGARRRGGPRARRRLGDLHPVNVLVRPDGRIALIDFEVACARGRGAPPDAGRSRASRAPRGRRGFDIDRYALACLRLFAFLPLTRPASRSTGEGARLSPTRSRELFPVPAEFLDEAVDTIIDRARARRDHAPPRRQADVASSPTRTAGAPRATRWPRAILASATPERDDRLFPGDINQFDDGGGLNLAHGAAGVLYALAATGAGRHPEHEEWLLSARAEPAAGHAVRLLRRPARRRLRARPPRPPRRRPRAARDLPRASSTASRASSA